MGLLRYAVVKYGKLKGNGQSEIPSSDYRVAAAFTTSTSASFVEDSGATDIVVNADEIFYCIPDEPMTLRFGGSAATVNLGIPLATGAVNAIEVHAPGKVSVIDIS